MSIRAITFDCYGTLIDWQKGMRAYIEPILLRMAAEPIDFAEWFERWERVQFDLLKPYKPYREVLRQSYGETMRQYVLANFSDEGHGLARSVADWPPFPDTQKGLRQLGRRFRLGLISNIDRDLLAGTLGQLQAPLSVLMTAEDANAYKPDPRPFELALERLGLPASEVLHAAFGWKYDLGTARKLGFKTAWINRSGEARPAGLEVDLEVATLAELAATLSDQGRV